MDARLRGTRRNHCPAFCYRTKPFNISTYQQTRENRLFVLLFQSSSHSVRAWQYRGWCGSCVFGPICKPTEFTIAQYVQMQDQPFISLCHVQDDTVQHGAYLCRIGILLRFGNAKPHRCCPCWMCDKTSSLPNLENSLL